MEPLERKSVRPPITIDRLTQANLESAVRFAKSAASGHAIFETLPLMGQDGLGATHITGFCDPVNRAMLNRVYEISHASFADAKVHRDTSATVTEIPTKHGFAFVEIQSAHEDSVDFSAKMVANA